MKKLIVFRFFSIAVTFIAFLLNYQLICQELPPIQNFTTQDYLAGNQNWSIAEAGNKYIYIANNEGLLEYNGATWKIYSSPNQSVIRSVSVINDRLYTGCFREFGYWERNEFGNLDYYSLSEKIKDKLDDDEHIWKIFSFDNWVVFQSLHNIYFYDTISHVFKIVHSETLISKAFRVDKDIFYHRLDFGLYKIENGISKIFSDDPSIKENNIISIFSKDNKLFILTSEEGFYFFENKTLKHWNIEADEELRSSSIYSSAILSDGSFIIGTISKGLIHLNKEGNIVQHFNKNHGLQNNTVLSVFEDSHENIWLGLDNGISLINLNSPYLEFNDGDGSLGTVYTSILHNELLYLGTNQGLFVKPFESDEKFKPIPGTEGQVWCLKEFSGELFCGHNNGTYLIEDAKATHISHVVGTWDIKPIKNSNLLLQGHYNGLNILEKQNGKWKIRNHLKDFNISSRQFELIDENILFVYHEYQGLYKLELDQNFEKVKNFSVVLSAPQGLKSDLIHFQNKLYYSCKEGVFEYQESTNHFIKDTLLTKQFLGEDQFVSGTLLLDSLDQSLWGFTKEHIVKLMPGKLTNQLKRIAFSLPNPFRGTVSGYENITRLKNNNYLIGTSNGYLIIDTDKLEEEKNDFYVNIASVQNSFLDKEKANVSFFQTNPFPYETNNFYFQFGVTVLDNIFPIQYQHKLEGIYNEWSDWTNKSEISYENLPAGNYIFKLRAKQGNVLSKNITSFAFQIEKPWYLSNKMILFYAALFILFILLINLINRWYYRKQKQKLLEEEKRVLLMKQLNSEKEIIQLKNEKLQNEIENKSNELMNSTSNVIKLNEMLTSIRSGLEPVKDEPKIKRVINMINQKLNNNSDWETFQEAFNNTDRDFLHKIKTAHPTLTPHDLRLCTYLRMNLTSKEIAPLLNISPRSVEIKRYRLRKKMNLEHENSLVEYILSI
ncbi:helix-turn-helix and ligand-binding sensor domain-containing protein [Namhaeicola litoreus]|uniref:Triple tyrosine motif-containing protein n=1 Tax=Namhaeicola litoreus TaxID=1052145 RepID=A0ABW3XXU2_9FLAO